MQFSMLLLLIEILLHYNIVLSQLIPIAIRVIVWFKRFCRDKRVVTSLALFKSIFVLKMLPVPGVPFIRLVSILPLVEEEI